MVVKSVAVPKGLRVVRLGAHRGGEYTVKNFGTTVYQQALYESLPRLILHSRTLLLIGDGLRLAKIVRCLLKDSSLPRSLLGELFSTATYLVGPYVPYVGA